MLGHYCSSTCVTYKQHIHLLRLLPPKICFVRVFPFCLISKGREYLNSVQYVIRE